jgi:hypothetical protein
MTVTAQRRPAAAGGGRLRRRLSRLLLDYSPSAEFGIGVASRSSLGPCTLIVRSVGPAAADLDDLAAWLGRQPGVARTAVRKAHLHVYLATEAMRSSFEAAPETSTAGSLGDVSPPSATVTIPDLGAPSSLSSARRATVGHAITALLTGQGWQVSTCSSADADVWISESEDPGEGPRRIDVAEVDSRHDRLRARHGGTLTYGDLIDDVDDGPGAAAGESREASFAQRAVSYLMTEAPRRRRLAVSDSGLRRKLVELDEILAARAFAAELGNGGGDRAPVSPCDEAAVRELIAGVEMAEAAAEGAASSLDPAAAHRCARALASEMHATREVLPAGDPLWRASAAALDGALAAAGG